MKIEVKNMKIFLTVLRVDMKVYTETINHKAKTYTLHNFFYMKTSNSMKYL